MQTALITVNYNQNGMVNEFLTSLLSNQGLDRTLVIIADLSDRPQSVSIKSVLPHQLVLTGKNKGYSFGVNLGLRAAQERGIRRYCILNNDIGVGSGFLSSVDRSFASYQAFTGKIYYAPGFEYHRDRYDRQDLGKVIWYAGGEVDWDHCLPRHRGVDEVDRGQYDRAGKVGFISGCLFCFDEKVLKRTGFWDEKYFLYFEDADYSERVKKAGFELIYNPSIIIWHKNAQSTGGSGSALHRRYQRINRLRFGLKYAPLRTKLHLIKNMLSGR